MREILRARFGFDDFRPQQEEICRAIADGNDTLVVMPTGAGKSLCYQLPGLARKGTTLVISPLVALIEDQVQRLLDRGIRAGRIHSGRSREESRETFKSYMRGELEFLFIAPERLAVPGFAEMIRRQPPSLIAVDEAHCISQWGHDFRPDYRLVGERLDGLSTPIVALTATATEQVQKDIVTQLRLRRPRSFIHGFRRKNLAIRGVETPPSERVERILEILSKPERLPAIVYAPTRKKSEEIASEFQKHLRSAAYHAGLSPEDRDRIQSDFLSGALDVTVATVAFGMGIDKANIRTVVHAAMPGSLEGYYQEIGRAGRDGQPSDVVLLYSFADRKLHEFLIDRDLEQAEEQRKHRLEQLDGMFAFAQGTGCRMLQLIRHFGDHADAREPCGICDRCVPSSEARPLDELEREVASGILASLAGWDGQAMGRLFEEASSANRSVNRAGFERLIAALVRARLMEIEASEFEKDGKVISFRKLNLLSEGRKIRAEGLAKIEIEGPSISSSPKSKSRVKRKVASPPPRGNREGSTSVDDRTSEIPREFEVLRAWRLTEARKQNVPAFRILSDRVLFALCEIRPSNADELLEVPGIGPRVASKYGDDLLRCLRG